MEFQFEFLFQPGLKFIFELKSEFEPDLKFKSEFAVEVVPENGARVQVPVSTRAQVF